MTVVPSKVLEKILITLSQIDDQGTVLEILFNNEDFGGSLAYYPSDEPAIISTGKIGRTGFYRLEIKAMAASGDSVVSEIDFYHSGGK